MQFQVLKPVISNGIKYVPNYVSKEARLPNGSAAIVNIVADPPVLVNLDENDPGLDWLLKDGTIAKVEKKPAKSKEADNE